MTSTITIKDRKTGELFNLPAGGLLQMQEKEGFVKALNEVLKTFGAYVEAGSIETDRLYLGVMTVKGDNHVHKPSVAAKIKERFDFGNDFYVVVN